MGPFPGLPLDPPEPIAANAAANATVRVDLGLPPFDPNA